MPGLVPGIHVFVAVKQDKTWMAGSSPAMTKRNHQIDFPRGQITRCFVQPVSRFRIISDFQKLSLTLDPNQLLNLRIPSRERGRWPSSLTLGRGAMDADALLTNGA
jgi:hypothetical protein